MPFPFTRWNPKPQDAGSRTLNLWGAFRWWERCLPQWDYCPYKEEKESPVAVWGHIERTALGKQQYALSRSWICQQLGHALLSLQKHEKQVCCLPATLGILSGQAQWTKMQRPFSFALEMAFESVYSYSQYHWANLGYQPRLASSNVYNSLNWSSSFFSHPPCIPTQSPYHSWDIFRKIFSDHITLNLLRTLH